MTLRRMALCLIVLLATSAPAFAEWAEIKHVSAAEWDAADVVCTGGMLPRSVAGLAPPPDPAR